MEVVVAVSGGTRSDAAVRWGAREALATGSKLVLLHAFAVPAVPSVAGPLRTPEMREHAHEIAEKVLHHAQRVAEKEAPGVALSTEAVRGATPSVLAERAAGSRVLVLGGHRRTMGNRLGSTVSACLHHATCPVTVVPREQD